MENEETKRNHPKAVNPCRTGREKLLKGHTGGRNLVYYTVSQYILRHIILSWIELIERFGSDSDGSSMVEGKLANTHICSDYCMFFGKTIQ